MLTYYTGVGWWPITRPELQNSCRRGGHRSHTPTCWADWRTNMRQCFQSNMTWPRPAAGLQQICDLTSSIEFRSRCAEVLGEVFCAYDFAGLLGTPFFFVRTFLAILRVCLAQSQHTGTIDMPNNGAKPDAGSCHAILACQCQVPPSAPALSAELFVGKHWQLASVLRLAAKRIKREYWEKILFLTWSIDKCQLILQVFPFSFDGFFLSISAKVKCTKTIKNRIYRDSYVTCWVSPSYGIGQHEATKMFSWSMRFDGAGNSTSPTHD